MDESPSKKNSSWRIALYCALAITFILGPLWVYYEGYVTSKTQVMHLIECRSNKYVIPVLYGKPSYKGLYKFGSHRFWIVNGEVFPQHHCNMCGREW